MKKLANKNILISLINILLIIAIIKICKITGFCFTIINLISPLFFGYCFAWIIRPIIEKMKKNNIKPIISTTILYIIILGIFILLVITLLPKIIYEVKNLIPGINTFINNHKFLIKIKNSILSSNILTNMVGSINNSFKNIFSVASTTFYSIIISFFISANNLRINHTI